MRINQDLAMSQLYYSKVFIKPLYGRPKEINLNRTLYNFSSNSVGELQQLDTQIFLPAFKNEELSFELKLNQDVKENHFVLKSLNNKPFKLNGSLVYKAIVSHGDKIDMGHNRFEFSYLKVNKADELEVSKNICRSLLPILLEGETGVGKSYLAKKIHIESDRVGPFVHINLSSFSSNLVESELFGHVKGAFTGAVNEKVGAIEQANGGTLFLDEIDSISKELQTKLLLFLDSFSFRKVGALEEKSVDIRLIFASGQSLKSLVLKNEFRKDMFYRICSGEIIKLAPLRLNSKRIKEVIFNYELEKDCVVSIRLEKYYCSLPWPGNIRQLRGHLDKKRVLTNGRKLDLDSVDDLLIEDGLELHKQNESFMKYKDLKLGYFSNVVSKLNGDVRLAAKTLDVSINTVKNVMREVS
jgi:transcriptional regulator with PAS, ATPase and Fis domain